MANNIFNRLQFVKHDEVFQTREDAYEYVKHMQIIDRPSLFAEPMVMLYESDDPEKGPNVILAIGSVGDGTQNVDNRTYFIDTQKTEDEIADLDERLEAAIKSLTLKPLESDTIGLHTEKTDDGTIISGDVKVASAQVISGISRDNKIKVVEEEGIFIFVDLEYTEDGKLVFRVNDEVKEYSVPTLVSGEYVYTGDDAEKIILNQNDGSQIKIDVGHLVDEWTVLPEDANPTPVVLKREEVSGEPCPHGVEIWQDVLTADVRIKDEDDNILKKTSDGRYLYVDGKSKNIVYYRDGVRSNVKEQLDRLKLANDNDNILFEKEDGFYAEVKLDYVGEENKLVFTTSNVDGTTKVKELELNSLEFIDDITYDPQREVIIIRYKTPEGEYKTVEIPASFIIEEWEVDNVNHNVTLDRVRNQSGKDKLSADVNIHDGDNNILEDNNHRLYVNGISENIKYDANGDKTVKGVLDTLTVNTLTISGNLNTEIERATNAENVLDNKIGTLSETVNSEISRSTEKDEELEASIGAEINRSMEKDSEHDSEISTLEDTIGDGFSTDVHETVTYKFNELSDKVNSEADKLQDEIDRSVAKDEEHDGKLSTIEGEIGSGFSTDVHETITYKFDTLENQVNSEANKLQIEINRSIAKDEEHDGRLDNIDTKIGDGFGPRNTVRDEIDTEKSVREDADNALRSALETEVNRAVSAETELSSTIASNYDTLTSAIDGEKTRAESQETALNGKIDAEKERAIEKENAISAAVSSYIVLNNTALQAEITRATSAETNIMTTLSHDIDTETSRAITQENAISEALDAYKELNNVALQNEVSRATEKENDLLQAIQTEAARAASAETSLQNEINGITLEFEDTNTIDFTKNANNVVTADVKVANSNDNIIVIDGEKAGIYATVSLSYNPGTNKIKLITTNGAQEEIQLNAGAIIDSMTYDSVNRAIVIIYTDSNGRTHTVSFPVNELFNDWNVDNPPTDSAIELTKTINGSGYNDTLSARVIISSHEDNALTIDGNALYVSNSAMTHAVEVADEVRDELKAVERAVLGNEVSTYTPPIGANYIGTATSMNQADAILDSSLKNLSSYTEHIADEIESISGGSSCTDKRVRGVLTMLNNSIPACEDTITYQKYGAGCVISAATSFMEADILLDNAFCEFKNNWFVQGYYTPSVTTYWKEIGQNKHLAADVILSYGKDAFSNPDGDLEISSLTDDYFTNTNALSIVNITNSSTGEPIPPQDNKYNGLYLSNIWDCGEYDGPIEEPDYNN